MFLWEVEFSLKNNNWNWLCSEEWSPWSLLEIINFTTCSWGCISLLDYSEKLWNYLMPIDLLVACPSKEKAWISPLMHLILPHLAIEINNIIIFDRDSIESPIEEYAFTWCLLSVKPLLSVSTIARLEVLNTNCFLPVFLLSNGLLSFSSFLS